MGVEAMGAGAVGLWAIAYGVGLLIVSGLVRHLGFSPGLGMLVAGLGMLAGGGVAALVLPGRWRLGPTAAQWLVAGVVALGAVLNYGLRCPAPAPLDISRLLTQGAGAGVYQEVWGRVEAMPRLTRSDQMQFWLNTTQVRRLDERQQPLSAPGIVQGKLYVTLPPAQGETLYPGQRVTVRGQIYAPAPAKNPNAFNFRQYLADHRCFAGFRGERVVPEKGQSPPRFALWRVRTRIAQAQAARLGTPAGPLVSAMALGRQAVTVPYDIQDAFIQAGMAHTLAASGFHVSLLLGVVLAVMGHRVVSARLSDPAQATFIAGSVTLIVYMLITGGQPSVMRATVMGFGGLAGLVLGRRVRPLGCWLLAVTLLLVIHPDWIDNIGFRLSVMATLGLVVAAKPIGERLEWLPTTLGAIAAVPLAAYLWTIPLALYHFNTLTTYSILLNMVTTPLVTVISLGGMVSGAVAVVWPWLGGVMAWVLWLPTHLLIALVRWEVGLPGSALATGHISLGQMLGLYGLYGLWGWGPTRRRGLGALLIGLVALGPLLYQGATLAEATVLAAGEDAVMVVQDRQRPLVINSGTDRTAFYTVVPYLRQAGINRLPSVLHGDDSDRDNWLTIAAKAPIRRFYGAESALAATPPGSQFHPLIPGQPRALGRQQVDYLQAGARGLGLRLFNRQRWLLLPNLSLPQQLDWVRAHPGLQSEVLWWHGEALAAEAIEAISASVAIASARTIDPATEERLRQQGIQVFCTERDGAITWSPRRGYRAYLAASPHSTASLE